MTSYKAGKKRSVAYPGVPLFNSFYPSVNCFLGRFSQGKCDLEAGLLPVGNHLMDSMTMLKYKRLLSRLSREQSRPKTSYGPILSNDGVNCLKSSLLRNCVSN